MAMTIPLCALPGCSLSIAVPVAVKSQQRHISMCPVWVFPQNSSASFCEITGEKILHVPCWVFPQYNSASWCEITAETLRKRPCVGVPTIQQCHLLWNHGKGTYLCSLPWFFLSTAVTVTVKSQQRDFYMCLAWVFHQHSIPSCCEITSDTLLCVPCFGVPSVQQCQFL